MALANDPSPTTIRLIVRDAGGFSATKEYVVPTSVWDPTIAAIALLYTIRDNLVTAFNAVSDGLVFRALITVGQTDTAAVVGLGEIENLASIVGNLSTLGKTTVLQIPSPDIGIFNGSTGKARNQVDIADTALIAYIDMFKLTGGDFSLSDGEFLDDTTPMDAGKRVFRKSNRSPN